MLMQICQGLDPSISSSYKYMTDFTGLFNNSYSSYHSKLGGLLPPSSTSQSYQQSLFPSHPSYWPSYSSVMSSMYTDTNSNYSRDILQDSAASYKPISRDLLQESSSYKHFSRDILQDTTSAYKPFPNYSTMDSRQSAKLSLSTPNVQEMKKELGGGYPRVSQYSTPSPPSFPPPSAATAVGLPLKDFNLPPAVSLPPMKQPPPLTLAATHPANHQPYFVPQLHS